VASLLDLCFGFFLVFLRCFALLCIISPLRVLLGLPVLVPLAMALACPVYSAMDRTNLLGLGQSSMPMLMELAFLQVLHGCLLGLPSALALECLPMAGRLFDASRGAQFAEQVCPDSGESVSPLENLGVQLAMLFFFSAGGLHVLVYMLCLHDGPQAEAWLSRASSPDLNFLQLSRVTVFSGQLLEHALILGAAALIFCLLFDLVYAVICRSLGRLNVFFDALALKLVIGIALFGLTAGGLKEGFVRVLRKAIELTIGT
jgi:flagellar biosynthesis protein FliR